MIVGGGNDKINWWNDFFILKNLWFFIKHVTSWNVSTKTNNIEYKEYPKLGNKNS